MKYAKFCREIKKYAEVDKSWCGLKDINNHTIPLAVRELKTEYKPCSLNCGQEVSNQHIEYKFIGQNDTKWLIKCDSCGLYQDPETGEMVDHRCLARYFPRRNTYI